MSQNAPESILRASQAEEEWEAAFNAYRAAQGRLAYAGAFLALDAWSTFVQPTNFARSVNRWLDYVVKVIRRLRARQRRLAQSYYQYGRALEIGETFGPPLSGDATLDGYRNSFLDQLQDAALLETSEPGSWDDEDDMGELREQLRSIFTEIEEERSTREDDFRRVDLDGAIQDFLDNWRADGNQRITVEDFPWPDRDSDDSDEVHRDVLEDVAHELWEEEEDQMDRDEALDGEGSSRESVLSRLEEALQRAGSRAAGRVMAATTNAADQVTAWAMDRDNRVYGVARGTGPNPCALCAAAAARGFVYHSVATAMTTGAGSHFKRYHPNCQCFPIIRWTQSQQLPQQSLEWQGLWAQAKQMPGDSFNNFRQLLHKRNAPAINARRRKQYARNKNTINARRRARRRASG